ELLRILPVRKCLKACVALEAARGPLPDVAEQLPSAGGARSLRVRAGRRRPEGELVQVRPVGGGGVVAPRIAVRFPGDVIVSSRLLPFGLRRQPLAREARQRIGLVPGDVTRRVRGVDGLHLVERPHHEAGALPLPVERQRDAFTLPPGPTFVGPPLAPPVAALLDERD